MNYIDISKVDTGTDKYNPAHEVVWTDGRNVRFRKGEVYKTPGKELLVNLPVSSAVRAIFAFEDYSKTKKILICTQNAIYMSNSDFSQITKLASGLPASLPWTFNLIAGLPVISNPGIAPRKLVGTTLSSLGNAPKFQTGATYMNRLIAGGITVQDPWLSASTTVWPARIAWSDIAMPEVWAGDTSADASLFKEGKAGYIDLVNPETGLNASENIRKIVTAGRKAYIFTDRMIWGLNPAEHPVIFAAQPIANNIELISPRAVAKASDSNDETIYFMGKKNFYSLSPAGLKELPPSIRDYALSVINMDALAAIFAFRNRAAHEVWFCVPTGTNTEADTAFIFHEELQVWSICDCTFTAHGEYSHNGLPIDIAGDRYGKLLVLDSGNNDYIAVTKTVGRDSADSVTEFSPAYGSNYIVPIDGYIVSGKMCIKSQDHINKYLQQVIPQLSPQDEDNILYIYIGTMEKEEDSPIWSQPQKYRVGYSVKTDFRKYGKWFQVMFRTWQKDSPFSIRSYKVGYDIGGLR